MMSANPADPQAKTLKVAIIGTGLSGMAAAWLLTKRHGLTVYELDERLGEHTNTAHNWLNGM